MQLAHTLPLTLSEVKSEKETLISEGHYEKLFPLQHRIIFAV